MNIVYLLESTDLCGGVKVVFNHVAEWVERGHRAAVFSPAPYPFWLKKCVPFHQLDLALFHETPFFHESDVIMATCPSHLVTLYPHLHQDCSGKKLIHLVQGYEGDYAEAQPMMETIIQAYSLDVPKITVSEELSRRVGKLYPEGHFMTCGQGLENDIFHPPEPSAPGEVPASQWGLDQKTNTDTPMDVGRDIDDDAPDCCSPDDDPKGIDTRESIVLIGALGISIKRIADGLLAFKAALGKKKDLKLVRVSTMDTREEEEALVGIIDEYHVDLTPLEVGALLRRNRGVLISPSSPGEGFGLPALEAMACGVPTVLTDIPSYRAFSKPRDYALFVPVGAPDKMADALLEISRNTLLKSRLVERGLAVAGEYSYSKVIEKLEACLAYV